MPLQITTPVGLTDDFHTRNPKMRAIYDWWYGAGAYAAAGSYATTRAGFNALAATPFANGDPIVDWRQPINALNETEGYVALVDGDGNLIVDAETGGVWVMIDS
jgi:hypothetical protein